MTDENIYTGTCFCHAVELTVTGEPVAMGYCHCESCRAWSAGPVNGFTLWKPDAVKIPQGAEHIGEFQKTEMKHSQMVLALRRPPSDRASHIGRDRRLCRHHPEA